MRITSLIQLKALEGLCDINNKPINILNLSRIIGHDYIALATHLRQLQKIGLIIMKKEGREIKCYATPSGKVVSKMLE